MSEDTRVRPPKIYFASGSKNRLVFDAGYDGGTAYLYESIDHKIHVANIDLALEEWDFSSYRKEWVVLSEDELFNDARIAKIRKLVDESHGVTNLDTSESEGQAPSS